MRLAVVGAGIVGLAVARQLCLQRPGWEVVVVDKEPAVARHQTGHNSGVIHAGIYYSPGSLKARLCRRGVRLLEDFCDEQGIPYARLGKLVVALDDRESVRLRDIRDRALANGIPDVRMLGPAGIRDIEPHVAGVAALHSPSTSVVDFTAVARALADDIGRRGGTVRLSSEVTAMRETTSEVVLETTGGDIRADRVIVCAGLQSSRVAALAGDDDDPRIVPFRGEYYRLTQRSSGLVRGLVYPVPDPRYPFLGIHLTRRINGSVDVGPNAVLALALQGYRRTDASLRDLADILGWSGFRSMARRHWRTGVREMLGSLSRRYFLAQARRYLPELGLRDLVAAPAGVRAQALRSDGSLVDDFWITTRQRVTLVRNAPSPAATSSLAIAEHICHEVLSAPAS
ncbi:L-2-hydroxyglutarate oxidase [Streptomyces sp. NPDC003697]